MTQVGAQLIEDDRRLLERVVRDRSHDAFEQIVRRYVDLVYATSLRRVRDRHLAEHVTQATFIVLSQRAHTISSSTPLPAWLHRTACYAASNALKMQRRRTAHEHRAAMEQPTYATISRETWSDIEPLPRVSSEDELPVTFAFKTREGGVGIAQITAMDRGVDEHGTISVSFKLVK